MTTQPEQIIDKNGKRTTVHKKLASPTADGRNLPVMPASWTARDENLADIDDLVVAYSSAGLLRAKSEGARSWSTVQFLGDAENGDRLVCKLEISYVDGGDPSYFVNDKLEQISEFWDVRLTGSIQDKTGHGIDSGNQVFENLERFSGGKELDAARATLKEAFDEMVFHTSRPGTPAQMEQLEAKGLKFYNMPMRQWAEQAIPEEDDHEFGSRALVHEVDANRLSDLLDLFLQAKNGIL